MLDILEKGGYLMYPIILLSVFAFAVFLERMIYLQSNRFIPQKFLGELTDILKKKNLEGAKGLCKDNPSAMATIALSILNNLELPLSRLMDVAEETGRFEAAKLDRFLPTLQTIASVSPLLGLLGTVVGMIKTFIVISDQGVGNAQALAGGISEALLTTAAGLSVAIPTLFFYYIVRHRSDKIALSLEKASSEVMNTIFKEARS